MGRPRRTPRSEQLRYSQRFRAVSTRYPLRVTEAYNGDTQRAMADTDEQVAATVADWERTHGFIVRNWRAIGAEEKGGA